MDSPAGCALARIRTTGSAISREPGWLRFSATTSVPQSAASEFGAAPRGDARDDERYTTARKEHVDELRCQREATLRDAEAEVAAAVTKERETIAVDLHDVISHHVSAIGVHATAARLNLAGTAIPGDSLVHTSLTAVQQSGQAAMVDLRRLLSLLHGGSGSADQPGVAMLPELFTGLRASGLQVTFVVYHAPPALPPDVDTTVYRVAQEMMTNALRHGDGRSARVELDCGDGRVGLTARNRVASAFRASVPEGSGLGLPGMRKRVEALGGSASLRRHR